MENIILTNNKDLRLVGVKVGVLSTLRFELPLVSASATRVEVIVTSGNVHSAYTATFVDSTKRWQCDIAASQFPAVGKQSYEIAYVLDGKQFWDGKGWIEIEDATTSGIEPQPRPEPYRYAVVSVNGYGADAQGAVRIPKTVISTSSPTTTDGFMEGDIYFNRLTGAMWTLCDVQDTLTWVFNYSNYYTKAETDEQIDKLAAYYITSDVQGNPFATRAALLDALAYYSGGELRVPTRNDYAVVLADESHGGAEWRYIYTVAAGSTTGQWEAQYPVEGVITYDNTVTKDSGNGVKSSGIWSMIWGALTALPMGFTSLYAWVVNQLAGKASTADVTLTPVYGDIWVVSPSVGPHGSTLRITYGVFFDPTTWALNEEAHPGSVWVAIGNPPADATSLTFNMNGTTVVATRQTAEHVVVGYVLGSQSDKPLASEAEAEALRTGKQDALSDAHLANIAAVSDALAFDATHSYAAGDPVVYNGTLYMFTATHTGAWTGSDVSAVDIIARLALKANRAPSPTAGNLAALDASGNPTDAGWTAGDLARYSLVAKTIDNGAVTLDDRAINAVAVSSSLASLTVNFPTATSGKARDFGLRLSVASGITTAPELALPQGVVCENADGEAPEIGADGAATILYFTETASGVFLVKGEVVTSII